MNLTLRRPVGLLVLPLLAVAAAAAVATPAEAVPKTSAVKVVKGNFPDPGLLKVGGTYHLYATSTGFKETSSAGLGKSGWTRAEKSMPRVPAWVATSNKKLWAPDVFFNGTVYVMYFTARSASNGHNCLGVATSSEAGRNFVAAGKPLLCSKHRGWEVIDPAAFQAPGGQRYLVYKDNRANVAGWDIRAVKMTPDGTALKGKGRSRSLVRPGSRIEAPSVVSHDGKVWLFTSRGSWTNCTYSTDAWSAGDLWKGTFKRAGSVMTSASTGLCGPGGATVVQDGPTTRIAFHAWKGNKAPRRTEDGRRQTWLGQVSWASGRPTLA